MSKNLGIGTAAGWAGRVFLASALLLSGCGLFSSGRPHLPRPTLSPNGEPLVGAEWPAHCEDALDAWFDRVDTDHDGRLDLAEFEADAVRQFGVMDLRHDGKVTVSELAAYRQRIMGDRYASISTPEIASHRRRPDYDARDRDEHSGEAGEARRADSSMPRPDSAGTMPADQPDPVMSADTDLDGSVTLDEFRILVHQNFADLDHDRSGSFGKSALHGMCHGED